MAPSPHNSRAPWRYKRGRQSLEYTWGEIGNGSKEQIGKLIADAPNGRQPERLYPFILQGTKEAMTPKAFKSYIFEHVTDLFSEVAVKTKTTGPIKMRVVFALIAAQAPQQPKGTAKTETTKQG